MSWSRPANNKHITSLKSHDHSINSQQVT